MIRLQGFGRIRAGPRIWRSVLAFDRDQRGTVAIQTLIFSVLLFGSAGLVLDTGRVYVAHSQMQAFADQMAIAAANELDGRDDALERASAAVFGIDGRSFLAKAGIEVGVFKVASVDFYNGVLPSNLPQNDTSEAFPDENRVARAVDGTIEVTGDPVDAANDATVAVVSVAEKEVRSAVAHMTAAVTKIAVATGIGSGDELFAAGLRIAAIAAASMERRSCAALSSLVLCNPWEGAADSPLGVPKDDPAWSVPGRSVAYFAPNFAAQDVPEAPQVVPNGASIFPWDVRNQLFRLVSPVADFGRALFAGLPAGAGRRGRDQRGRARLLGGAGPLPDGAGARRDGLLGPGRAPDDRAGRWRHGNARAQSHLRQLAGALRPGAERRSRHRIDRTDADPVLRTRRAGDDHL